MKEQKLLPPEKETWRHDGQVPGQQSPGQDGNPGPWGSRSSREKGLCCRGRMKVEKGAPGSPSGNKRGVQSAEKQVCQAGLLGKTSIDQDPIAIDSSNFVYH